MKTLYKQTATGSIQVWQQEISPDGKSYRTISGKLNGKMVTSEWSLCQPKNVGKANETTAENQCLLEVEANYKKKLAQGNYKDVLDENVSEDNYYRPMLAKKYGEDYVFQQSDCDKGIIYSQPKLDGIRCIIDKNGMWSRQGKPIISAPHILKALEPLFKINPEFIFDGELYSDKFSDNFNEIISMARKSKPEPEDFEKSEKYLQYWAYDFPSHKGSFSERFTELENVLSKIKETAPSIKIVSTSKIKNEEQLNELYAEYMEEGYEGQMVRISGANYENKRSKQLQKRKEFYDDEFIIMDITEGDGNRSGMAGRIFCKDFQGKLFKANMRGNRDSYRELLENKTQYIGTLVTIRYQELTPDEKIPRFGVAIKFWKTKEREM
jgi:DNA ligase 1